MWSENTSQTTHATKDECTACTQCIHLIHVLHLARNHHVDEYAWASQIALMAIPVGKIYLFGHLVYIIVIICYNLHSICLHHISKSKKIKRAFEIVHKIYRTN